MGKMPDGWILIPKEHSSTEFELVRRELVCCRNCKCFRPGSGSKRYGICLINGDGWPPNGFCSYGEPKEG